MTSASPVDAALHLAMDAAPIMLWTGTAAGALTFVNRAWTAFRGRPMAKERGQGWIDGIFADDRDNVRDSVSAACRAGRPFEIGHRLLRADGELRWVSMNGAPLAAPDAALHGYVGSCIDVTEQRPESHANGSIQSRLETLIGSARDMAYRLALVPERTFDYAVGAVEAITGHRAEEFYRDPQLARRAMHPDDAEMMAQYVDEPDRLSTTDVVIRWLHADGRTVWAEHRRRPVFDASGRLVAIEGIAHDITGLIESQQRLKESEDQMRQLAARLQSAREEERAQVARELHDELGQTLTALKLEIGRTISALNLPQVAPVVIDRMQSLIGLSEIGISTVKRIATSLRPPALDHLGLTEAIRWEALAFKARSGLRCHVRSNRKATRLTREQQTAAFRIFQEALTNVARHAKASAVTVTLTEQHDFDLRIQDNGQGISEHEAGNPRAIGLIGMRERASLAGGTFHISGRRGKGTTVLVHMPLPSSSPATARSRPAHAARRR